LRLPKYRLWVNLTKRNAEIFFPADLATQEKMIFILVALVSKFRTKIKMSVCQFSDCSCVALYGPNEQTQTHCWDHKEPNMIKKRGLCNHKNCESLAKYGTNDNKCVRCHQHKTNDMILTTELCKFPSCAKKASFGPFGEKLYCKQHKTDSMSSTYHLCRLCHKQASYGTQEEKNTHCVEHKTELMFMTRGKLCQYPECKTRAGYGTLEEKNTRCAKHKTKEMVCTRLMSNTYQKSGKRANSAMEPPRSFKRQKRNEEPSQQTNQTEMMSEGCGYINGVVTTSAKAVVASADEFSIIWATVELLGLADYPKNSNISNLQKTN
jgi:hypothetical protein